MSLEALTRIVGFSKCIITVLVSTEEKEVTLKEEKMGERERVKTHKVLLLHVEKTMYISHLAQQ